jgi:GTPase SAR1 family protein
MTERRLRILMTWVARAMTRLKNEVFIITKMSNKRINIMFIGDGAVGKTSLINQFDTRKFKKEHIRSIGIDSIRVNYTTQEDKYECEVKLWDTAG